MVCECVSIASIVELVSELLPKLVDLALKVNVWLFGKIKDVQDWAGGIGKGIVDGIQKGISDAWSKFTGWVSEQLNKLPDFVKQALGIHSPSRVMAEQVG